MKIIIGLGNPGLRYKRTRHNAGFMVLDELASRHRLRFRKHAYCSICAEGRIAGEEVLLMKPQTYMNRSGIAAGSVMGSKAVDLEEVLVINDDIALPLGKIRLRPKGSSGGHNGLKSLIERLGPEFPRLKLGVASGKIFDASDYVLRGFKRSEKKELALMLKNASDCVEFWLKEGLIRAMDIFN